MIRSLVDWSAPGGLVAPQDVMRRLRAIRPCAELLYQGEGVWMLGEVRWNWERYRRGVKMLVQHVESRKELGVKWMDDPRGIAFMREGWLLMQGFVWIGDYVGMPDGRIEIDYARKCWKEDHGVLDGEYHQMAEASSDKNSLLRKIKVMEDRIRLEGKSDFNIIMRKRRSFSAQRRVAAATTKARQAHMSPGGIITL